MSYFAPRLNDTLDTDALARAFRQAGRVQIADFLDPVSAVLLERSLLESDEWMQLVNSGDKVFELSRTARIGFDSDRKARLQAAIDAGARWGFQYRYEALRVSDDDRERAASARPVDIFARFLCSPEVQRFLRIVIGNNSVRFADAQATCYTTGDFLTEHDDDVAEKNRVAAYVYNLTPVWRPEWGGLLLFHQPNGTASALIPSFNTLNLFAVPQSHSVSMVTPSAGASRISVTGWLRAT